MSVAARLLKVGSMAGSLGLYVPATVAQKALGLLRVLLFAHLLRRAQGEYGLWGLGMMIFSIAGPLLCLGSNHVLARYVSHYEARGRLGEFYRRVRWAVLACCAATALAALAASEPITRAVIAVCPSATQTTFQRQLMIWWAALANAFLLALYFNLLSFMNGLRVYRMASAMELLFAATFTVLGCASLAAAPTGLALLLAHLLSVGAALAVGAAMVHRGIGRLAAAGPPATGEAAMAPGPPVEAEHSPTPEPALAAAAGGPAGPRPGELGRAVRFGLVAMIGHTLWVAVNYVSFWLVSRRYGTSQGGGVSLFLQLAQPVAYLSAAAYTVIFSHVARHWEGGRKDVALFNLQTSFKAVALGTMSLAVLIQLASPLWVRLLDPAWRGGLALLPGLLLFFQAVGNLGLLNMVCWLRERPGAVIATAAAGGGGNLLLALWWMPHYGAEAAAWAAGVGMAVGGGLAAGIYFLASRARLHAGTYLVMASPLLLVANRWAPAWAVACAWGLALAGAFGTGWVFDPRQKALLKAQLKRVGGILAGRQA